MVRILVLKDGNWCPKVDHVEGQDLQELLKQRGPDANGHAKVALPGQVTAGFYGWTLQFQGHLARQPLADAQGNLLLWNGEIFGGIAVPADCNDGEVLLQRLAGCLSDEQILKEISTIQGPWALVYWQANTQKLWFGRDLFGRRSLLIQSDANGLIKGLTSVAMRTEECVWRELPANGVYCLDCSDMVDISGYTVDKLLLYPWLNSVPNQPPGISPLQGCLEPGVIRQYYCEEQDLIQCSYGSFAVTPCVGPFNTALPSEHINEKLRKVHPAPGSGSSCCTHTNQCESVSDAQQTSFRHADKDHVTAAIVGDQADSPNIDVAEPDLKAYVDDEQSELAELLIKKLSLAVQRRVQTQADVCNLCLQQRLSDTSQMTTSKTSSSQTLAIATDAHIVSGRTASQISSAGNSHSDHSNVITSTNVVNGYNVDRAIDGLSGTGAPDVDMSEQKPVAGASVPGACERSGCEHARVAVLFSGGIDSLMIAALADSHVPTSEPIDLLNVAFAQKTPSGNPTNKKTGNKNKSSFRPEDCYNVPDRITGRQGHQILCSLNPNRVWNFVEINVTLEELQKHRQEHIVHLVSPSNTVLDDSIGCAIWFAARGQGVKHTDSGSLPYVSTARVVLVGMGADEQLAGYSRHRAKFSAGGWSGLVDEIRMEIDRISSRNLGRDDRIIADHGKESRLPFLDEEVVSFLNAIPVWQKANLHLPRGLGEKFLLRHAASIIGLGSAVTLPKRAIQFGSRIAKMENKKEKASDKCLRLE